MISDRANLRRSRFVAGALLSFAGLGFLLEPTAQGGEFPVPEIPFAPRTYVCYRTADSITIDGKLDESAWQKAPWTEAFVDIRGEKYPAPRYRTRAKMLWDDEFFYFAAELEEPHLWARLTQRDTVIFHDNDFEIFIDPDGDTHLYYEFEMNARNTVWDLLLVKPYRDGGPPIDGWDIHGLRTAVHLDGTLNDPSDMDRGWTLEVAMPWQALEECAGGASCPPRPGDYWRVNFSRVEWWLDVVDGRYQKRVDPATGRKLPEENWVWSPQGLVNMHYPEMWGVVWFSDRVVGSGSESFRLPGWEQYRWFLRQVYYAEQEFRARAGHYTADADSLQLTKPPWNGILDIRLGPGATTFVAGYLVGGEIWLIREDGRVWRGR